MLSEKFKLEEDLRSCVEEYNNISIHSSTGFSPSQLHFNQDTRIFQLAKEN